MKNQIETVAVVKCASYDQKKVDKAVEQALKLINFKLPKNKKVLIKPNVVGKFPKTQLAATTNPTVIEAVCKILKKNNCKISIGDSPFTNPKESFKASGIDKVAKKYGKLVIFEQDKITEIKDKKAKVLKKFRISKTLNEADLIINMPKLKTHKLTKYTGALKNLYGCILGGVKQQLHLKAQGDKDFSEIIADIYQNIAPELTIMDGIIGMEGEGPTSGHAKKSGLILASKSGIALDIAGTKIIGLNPKKVYAIKSLIERKIYPSFEIKLAGISKLPNLKFKAPKGESSATQRLMNKIFKERPIVVDKSKCIKCGLCRRKCPAKAITMTPYPVIDKKKCIRCFCCMEICPENALQLKGDKTS